MPERAPERAPDRVSLEVERAALAAELNHWRRAARSLGDLELVAAPAAWAALESYLGLGLRTALHASAARVVAQVAAVSSALAAAGGPDGLARVRQGLLTVRRRYVQAETVVDFYGDAVNTRTNPRLGAVLRGLDALAVDSMERVLRPLSLDVPPVLTYLDKGLGASILKSGVRLWDSSLSPAAAIKITRHNLWQPTSLLHEVGHQVSHLTGWSAELGAALHAVLAPVSAFAADLWRGWASELAADVYAFALLGYAPVTALATVVDGPTRAVFRMPFGDPHPFGWLRVQFNAALCRSWYGPGPWDGLAAGWAARHRLRDAPPEAAEAARLSLPVLPALADVCTRAPMRAFGGVPLSALADPRRVAPAELERLAHRAGDSLYTSSYLQRLEPLRILAWTVLRGTAAGGTGGRDTAGTEIETWLGRLGGAHATAV
ncbi:hypothetical protein ACIA8O_02870 [Kitasatospora sp. NPDC051853]|uniref:hypothetical protein n=1 Tax=Kitasatospora sp. NPDC051853 TaxID=3364058 RepID=UPI00379D9723